VFTAVFIIRAAWCKLLTAPSTFLSILCNKHVRYKKSNSTIIFPIVYLLSQNATYLQI
jgi:hypothetical protein